MGEQYKRKPNTECVICRNPIYRRPSEIQKNRSRVFCSQACYGKACRKEKPCIVCGALILAGLNKKTCSRGCANKHREGIKYGIGRPKDKVKTQRSLKIRLLGLRGKQCEKCSYNKFEILNVHHKNRDNKDNRLENLELICPNCHAEEHYLKNSWLTEHEHGGDPAG
ncbi:HNH endonuclease [Patescibacteria group bacterium]|nr:HNH endonuclease [Patescibacteria group bacterium]